MAAEGLSPSFSEGKGRRRGAGENLARHSPSLKHTGCQLVLSLPQGAVQTQLS